MSNTVTSGVFRFFTRTQLDDVRAKYVTEVQSANTRIVSASVNGQSLTFAVGAGGRELTLEEWGDALAHAYNQLGEFRYGTPGRRQTAASFSTGS